MVQSLRSSNFSEPLYNSTKSDASSGASNSTSLMTTSPDTGGIPMPKGTRWSWYAALPGQSNSKPDTLIQDKPVSTGDGQRKSAYRPSTSASYRCRAKGRFVVPVQGVSIRICHGLPYPSARRTRGESSDRRSIRHFQEGPPGILEHIPHNIRLTRRTS